MLMAATAFMPKVNGIRSATPMVDESPGSAPMMMPPKPPRQNGQKIDRLQNGHKAGRELFEHGYPLYIRIPAGN